MFSKISSLIIKHIVFPISWFQSYCFHLVISLNWSMSFPDEASVASFISFVWELFIVKFCLLDYKFFLIYFLT